MPYYLFNTFVEINYMQNLPKIILSFSLFLTLFIGVTGYYYQIHSKSCQGIRISNFSDNNEEDWHKEDFIKRIVFEHFRNDGIKLLSSQNIHFPHTPDCLLEGHSGQETPPPWL